MRIAREGWNLVLAVSAVAAAVLVGALIRGGTGWWLAGIALAVLAVGVAAFFRDPGRRSPVEPGLVLSPADGRVIDVGEVVEEEWIGGPALRISIFLSLFDVHVNRYPVQGTVEYVERRSGGFLAAWKAEASAGNERLSVGIRTPEGDRVLVRQVAGLVARRIVNVSRVGDRVAAGGRMGMIRFGSRTDLFLPPTTRARVQVGDRAAGGETIMGLLAERS